MDTEPPTLALPLAYGSGRSQTEDYCSAENKRGFFLDEINNLISQDQTVSTKALKSQTSKTSRFMNWCSSVDKAEASRAIYNLSHAKTAQEAHYHYERLKSTIGANFKENLKCNWDSHSNTFTYSLDIGNSLPIIELAKFDGWDSETTQSLNTAPPNEQTQLVIKTKFSHPIKKPSVYYIRSPQSRTFSKELNLTRRWVEFMLDESAHMPGCAKKLNKIRKFSVNNLEHQHDFIQYLFPANMSSAYTSKNPKVTDTMAMEVQFSSELQKSIQDNIDELLLFLGLERVGNDIQELENKIVNFSASEQREKWKNNPFNHNRRRLTRLIEFLSLVGYKNFAHNLNGFLQKQEIIEKTETSKDAHAKTFWENKVNATKSLGVKHDLMFSGRSSDFLNTKTDWKFNAH